jgi:hypothetical protein
MRVISSRPAIAIAVTLVTVIVCSFGIRAELNRAQNSILDHRSSPGENAAHGLVAADTKRESESAPP